MNFESIQKYLNELSEKYGLINDTLRICQKLIDERWKERGMASFGGYSKEEIKLAFDQQELIFKHCCRHWIIIRTRIGIYVEDKSKIWFTDLEPIGYYELDTDEQGQPVDDWFVIEKT